MGRKQFSPDVEEYLHKVCLNAVLRAMNNGTFKSQKERVKNQIKTSPYRKGKGA